MSESKQAWDEVGEHFAGLGRRVKEQYRAAAPESAEEREAVRDALRGLAASVEHALAAVGDVVRDSGFRDEAKQATKSFGDALAATFDEVGDELRKAFKRG